MPHARRKPTSSTREASGALDARLRGLLLPRFLVLGSAIHASLLLASDTSPGLFSTRVIRGSNSSPDLDRVNYEKPIVSIPDGTCVVPSISPLETLHNALSLKQVDRFLSRMTDMSMRTPFSTPPLYPSTPVTPFLEVSNTFIPGPEVTSKAGSGRSSPVMPPAKDIAERLEKLVRDDKVVDTPTATPTATPSQTPR